MRKGQRHKNVDLVEVGGVKMSVRDAVQVTGLSDSAVRYRVSNGIPMDAPKKGQAVARTEAPPPETIEDKRNREAREYQERANEPGNALSAEAIYLAGFDRGRLLTQMESKAKKAG